MFVNRPPFASPRIPTLYIASQAYFPLGQYTTFTPIQYLHISGIIRLLGQGLQEGHPKGVSIIVDTPQNLRLGTPVIKSERDVMLKGNEGQQVAGRGRFRPLPPDCFLSFASYRSRSPHVNHTTGPMASVGTGAVDHQVLDFLTEKSLSSLYLIQPHPRGQAGVTRSTLITRDRFSRSLSSLRQLRFPTSSVCFQRGHRL